MLTPYGPIPKVLLRGTFFDLEDKIAAYKGVADEGRGDSDVSSIDADIALMEQNLERMRPHLSR